MIRRIQGRADDLIWGLRKGTSIRHFIYQDYISRKIISTSEDIDDYQAIQESYNQIRIRLKIKPDADQKAITQAIQQGIWEIFDAYDCILPEIDVKFGTLIVNPNSGKLKELP